MFFLGIYFEDIIKILLTIYFLFTLSKRNLSNNLFLFPVIFIILLAILVIFSMPFRGDINLIQSFQVGRLYLILLLSFVISDDIIVTGNLKFEQNLIIVLGIYFSIIAFINILSMELVAKIWKGIGNMITEKAWGTESDRYVIKSNSGLLFTYYAFIIIFLETWGQKLNLKRLILLITLFIGMFFIGWRAILLTTLFAVVIHAVINIQQVNHHMIKKWLLLSLFFVFVIIAVDNLGEGIISSKFISAQEELSGNYQGTFAGRIERAMNYQLPIFWQNKWFGVGFVHKDSAMAKEVHYFGDQDTWQNLYYFDFGYGSLLVMFGMVGTLLIIYWLFRHLRYAIKFYKKTKSLSFAQLYIVLIAFLIGNISFGVFISDIGLIILCFSFGIANAYYLSMRKADNYYEV